MTEEEQALKDAATLRKLAFAISNHPWKYKSIIKSGDKFAIDNYKDSYRNTFREAMQVLANNII